jgi:hypothetical protein
LISFMMMMPFNLAKFGIDTLSKKLTMTYSNMPCPEVPWKYDGKKAKWVVSFLPAIGEMLCGMAAISHGSILKISLITDLQYIQYPDEFMDIMERKVQDFLYTRIGTSKPKKT